MWLHPGYEQLYLVSYALLVTFQGHEAPQKLSERGDVELLLVHDINDTPGQFELFKWRTFQKYLGNGLQKGVRWVCICAPCGRTSYAKQ